MTTTSIPAEELQQRCARSWISRGGLGPAWSSATMKDEAMGEGGRGGGDRAGAERAGGGGGWRGARASAVRSPAVAVCCSCFGSGSLSCLALDPPNGEPERCGGAAANGAGAGGGAAANGAGTATRKEAARRQEKRRRRKSKNLRELCGAWPREVEPPAEHQIAWRGPSQRCGPANQSKASLPAGLPTARARLPNGPALHTDGPRLTWPGCSTAPRHPHLEPWTGLATATGR
ncbi:hypothetical protein BS78_01G426200 [Paspalum vaginatum]|nr:hypothetical protein BS78_01G426200 [Paspalum vaginatum]